jgi:predicted Zn-dependent protease
VRARLALEDLEGALELLAGARERHPDQFELVLYTGQAEARRGRPRPALEALQRACELNPAYGPSWAARGAVELALGLAPEAEASLARALERGVDDPRTRLLLGNAQLAQRAADPEALARARATFEECTREFARSAPAWAHLAEALALAGEPGPAREALDEAARWNPAYERLGELRDLIGAREDER